MPREPNLKVSLEPHLVDTLRPLIDPIPSHLSTELSKLLPDESSAASQSTTSPMIPYVLLQSISKWARTEEGKMALKSQNPPLDPFSYSMVALLAGTRTSPDKKFPALPRVPTRSEGVAREISDRRAIVAVLNAILSVICTGAAAWWAAQRTGWRDEWVRDTCGLAMCDRSHATHTSRKSFCRCSLQLSLPFPRLVFISYGILATRGGSSRRPQKGRPQASALWEVADHAISTRTPPWSRLTRAPL
jgi:hypothetical protein